jgi:hypothetical protein
MVHITEVSAGFSALSGLIGIGLLIFAVRAYLRTRERMFAFLVGAFLVFSFKAFLVSYSLLTNVIGHETLELVDAVGDLGTVALLLAPLLLPETAE